MNTSDRLKIRNNLLEIRQRIEAAAQKSCNTTKDIVLIAVTKTIDTDRMKLLVNEGSIDFGENKVQELMSKYDSFGEDIRWHLIGHLQTNKVKYVIGKTELIHSVDSLNLLREIDKRAHKLGIVQKVLLQVNVSGEATKYGFKTSDIEDVIELSKEMQSVLVKGLMTMAPNYKNPEETRPVFRDLKSLFDNLSKKHFGMEYLSMGMTNDFEVAIEEGANMIRLGTAIFR